MLAAALFVASLALSGRDLVPAAQIILVTYVPLALVEAAVTGAAVSFPGRVTPELLLPAKNKDG